MLMNKMKKLTALILLVMLTLALTACGGGASEETADDGQNPIMNYVGTYANGRATILIEADGDEGAKATVTWGSSAWETSKWTMSGSFDPEELRFEYHDCVKTDYKYKDEGEVDSQEEAYTGGHGFMFFKEGDPVTLTWQDDQENVAEDVVFEYVGALPDEEAVGMANPWQTADSLAAAAEGAGLDGFDISEGSEISLGKVEVEEYRYMDGIAEADIPIAAVDMTIRKGKASAAAEKGDISGDYGEYKYNWTQNIKGLEVSCFGNREGEATKTIWGMGDYLYSITAFGAGGDEDFGLSADDVSSLINGIQ